ncbi:TPA: hypothetical protein JD339_21390 [Citrobacter freundii]|nr:hypothetical protein [Citrobacter freundii]HCD1267357.1 ead/Ea22-like family protein [Citrobacter freundii]
MPHKSGYAACTGVLRESNSMKPTYEELALQLANAESKCREMAAENEVLKAAAEFATAEDMWIEQADGMLDYRYVDWYVDVLKAAMETPATDAFLAEVRAQARKEGAHFVANRMLAAWDAGFIDDTAKNAADIARMILTSTEFMADAPEGDFDRSFADGVLKDIAAQLRKGAAL